MHITGSMTLPMDLVYYNCSFTSTVQPLPLLMWAAILQGHNQNFLKGEGGGTVGDRGGGGVGWGWGVGSGSGVGWGWRVGERDNNYSYSYYCTHQKSLIHILRFETNHATYITTYVCIAIHLPTHRSWCCSKSFGFVIGE